MNLLIVLARKEWEKQTKQLCEQAHPADVWTVGLDKVPTVAEIRSLIPFASLTPTGELKLAIIYQADLMRGEAANTLLKLLEEPPSYLQIILLAESWRVLPTIRSRVFLLESSPDFATMIPEVGKSQWQKWGSSLFGYNLENAQERQKAKELLYLMPLLHGSLQSKVVEEGLMSQT